MNSIKKKCTFDLHKNLVIFYTDPRKLQKQKIQNHLDSVPDPWYFGVDPDPRIHASD